MRWLLRLLLLPGGGGGAVAGVCAVTVAVDCRYGPCKSRLPVINISIKKEHTKDSRHLRLESFIPNSISNNRRARPQCVGGCRGPWKLGGTWWKGGRLREVEQTTN